MIQVTVQYRFNIKMSEIRVLDSSRFPQSEKGGFEVIQISKGAYTFIVCSAFVVKSSIY